ncbi:MAG: cyclic nucleotide-binding domain-containing protein [Alphaproteobacteria bacterium]|nr:cyclic nucleotide-binding domain-containing protein [Alphaproteobacteria bacterium]
MSSVMNRKVYPAGTTIFNEGEVASRAFLVEKGTVEIRKVIDGKPVILGNVERGGIFGEMALIDNQPRMATAVSKDEVSLVVISEQMFEEKVSQADPFIRALLRIFVRNIREGSKRAAAQAASGSQPHS